jgi:hypothetical protein
MDGRFRSSVKRSPRSCKASQRSDARPETRTRRRTRGDAARVTRSGFDLGYRSAEDSYYDPPSEGEDEDGKGAAAKLAKEAKPVPQIDRVELQTLCNTIRNVVIPTWVDRPPANLADASHGKLKADVIYILFTVIFPFVFVPLWSAGTSRQQGMLANMMALVVGLNIACSYSTSDLAANHFAEAMRAYLSTMLTLFPHVHLVPIITTPCTFPSSSSSGDPSYCCPSGTTSASMVSCRGSRRTAVSVRSPLPSCPSAR